MSWLAAQRNRAPHEQPRRSSGGGLYRGMPPGTLRAQTRQRASVRARRPHGGRRFGVRIGAPVDATLKAVGQNTNLGIILLCAPLAAAAEAEDAPLRSALAGVLDRLDRVDAPDVL